MTRSVSAVRFEAAEPIWTTAEQGEINSSVVFTAPFEWDGASPLSLRLAGCSVFKVSPLPSTLVMVYSFTVLPN